MSAIPWNLLALSPHFQAREFFKSEWGSAEPTDTDIGKATKLCFEILEPLRLNFGEIKITSGKRSVQHNADIGGVKTSEHLYLNETAACDIVFTAGNAATRLAFAWAYGHLQGFYGQLIIYIDQLQLAHFIHVSLPSNKHRGESLTATAEHKTPRKYAHYHGGKIIRP
jgi:hypothetical protein